MHDYDDLSKRSFSSKSRWDNNNKKKMMMIWIINAPSFTFWARRLLRHSCSIAGACARVRWCKEVVQRSIVIMII